jgi:hypothetical protein
MSQKEKIVKSKDLIKESWQMYTKNLSKFIQVLIYGLVGIVPMLGVMLVVIVYANLLGDKAPEAVNIILGILAFAAFVYSFYIAIVYSIRSKVASILLIKKNFTSAKENFKEAKPYFVKFLGVSMLLFVLVIAWGFALIIPAIIFAVYYGFAQYVLLVEGKRPFSAIERSYDLVRGYWWPVFGRFVLIFAVALFINWILSMPMSGMEEDSAGYLAYSLLLNLIWAVLSPYFLIYSYKIYQSLKETNK